MRVDFPSSTEPQVTSRRSSVLWAASEVAIRRGGESEVAKALPVLHRGLAEAVVGAGLAALGDARRGDLLDDRLDRLRARLDAPRTSHVTDGAEAHGRDERILAFHPLDVRRDGVQH